MKVIGIEHVKFKAKDGEEVSFDRVSCVEKLKPEKGEGETAHVFNVASDKAAGLTIGEEVEPLYNRFGKVRRFDYIVNQ